MSGATTKVSSSMELITLGTQAGPAIRVNETGIASAVVVGGNFYMVDFGLGCTRAAHSAGLRGRRFRAGFITHLHSDHVIELPGFLLWNWGHQVEGFESRVELYGPGQDVDDRHHAALAGTAGMVQHLMKAFAYDLHIRTRDEGRPPLNSLIETTEIPHPLAGTPGAGRPFTVFEDNYIQVSAVLVDHPPVRPALAFRFDTEDGSVTFSGDTAECSALVELAQGTDILVHEAVNLDYYLAHDFNEEFINHQRQSHTSPEGAGRVAQRAGAKTLVLSHLAGVGSHNFWQERAARTFDGTIHVARSGDRFRLAGDAASRHVRSVPHESILQ